MRVLLGFFRCFEVMILALWPLPVFHQWITTDFLCLYRCKRCLIYHFIWGSSFQCTSCHQYFLDAWQEKRWWKLTHTVDGQNPAPPRMMIIPFQVVQDFFHQRYVWGRKDPIHVALTASSWELFPLPSQDAIGGKWRFIGLPPEPKSLGGWFRRFLEFSPRTLGMILKIWLIFFFKWVGWNHQPVNM